MSGLFWAAVIAVSLEILRRAHRDTTPTPPAATLRNQSRLTARCQDCGGRYHFAHPANRNLGRAFHLIVECPTRQTQDQR